MLTKNLWRDTGLYKSSISTAKNINIASNSLLSSAATASFAEFK